MADDANSRLSGALPGPRLDLLSVVFVETKLYGNYACLARNVNAAGIFLETLDLLPLGTEVRFRFEDSGEVLIVAYGVVQQHHYINHSARGELRATAGMSVRFKRFEAEKGRRTVSAGQQTLQ